MTTPTPAEIVAAIKVPRNMPNGKALVEFLANNQVQPGQPVDLQRQFANFDRTVDLLVKSHLEVLNHLGTIEQNFANMQNLIKGIKGNN